MSMPKKAQRESKANAGREAAAINELRKQYEAHGYRALDRLPLETVDGLSAYRPDLVVQKGDEVIVVEVKRVIEARETADVRVVRDLVESHPGWRFRLVLLGGSDEVPPSTTRSPRRVLLDYKQREARARVALRNGHLEEALALLWIAIEGALRTYFTRSGEMPSKGVTAISMLRSLHNEGMLDDAELDVLASGYDARNLAVHAFKVPLKKTAVERIFKTARELVSRLHGSGSRTDSRPGRVAI